VVDGTLETLVHETPISPRMTSAKYGSSGSTQNHDPRPPLAGTLPAALLFASAIRRRHLILEPSRRVGARTILVHGDRIRMISSA